MRMRLSDSSLAFHSPPLTKPFQPCTQTNHCHTSPSIRRAGQLGLVRSYRMHIGKAHDGCKRVEERCAAPKTAVEAKDIDRLHYLQVSTAFPLSSHGISVSNPIMKSGWCMQDRMRNCRYNRATAETDIPQDKTSQMRRGQACVRSMHLYRADLRRLCPVSIIIPN